MLDWNGILAQVSTTPVNLFREFVPWYWIFYLVSFLLVFFLSLRRLDAKEGLSRNEFYNLSLATWVGLIIGARVGYILIYVPAGARLDPIVYIDLSTGGMSFHGALIGGIIAAWLMSLRQKTPLLTFTDLIVVPLPLALFLGRIGNLINGELWGRPTDLPWGIVVPQAGPEPRHPSQLYEAMGEGILLWLLLRWLEPKTRRRGQVSALFLILYSLIRFGLEFFRAPDPQIGLTTLALTLGQWLSILLLTCGIILWIRLSVKPRPV